MKSIIKEMIEEILDSRWKEWFDSLELLEVNNSPQSLTIHPIFRAIDYRSILLNTKNQFMMLRSDTFGTGFKKKEFRNNNSHKI